MTAPAVCVISFSRVSIWAPIPPAGVVHATYAPWGRTSRRLALCRALLFLAVSVAFPGRLQFFRRRFQTVRVRRVAAYYSETNNSQGMLNAAFLSLFQRLYMSLLRIVKKIIWCKKISINFCSFFLTRIIILV